MALEVTLEASTIQVDSEYDASNPASVNLNLSGQADGFTMNYSPQSGWATIQVNLDITTMTGNVVILRCDPNESTTQSREQLYTITISPYHIEYNEYNDPIQVPDPPSILELTIIQSPALIVPDSAELTLEEMAQMAGETINSLRVNLFNSNTYQIITQLIDLAQTRIITIPNSLKDQIIMKITGFDTTKGNIQIRIGGIDQEIFNLAGPGNPNSELSRLQSQLRNEQSKGDKGRPGKIQLKIDELMAEVEELTQEKSQVQYQLDHYNQVALETLQGSELLNKIETEIRNFENQCGAVAKSLPTLIQNTITSIFEPMGNVAACAVGPVVTATNPLQIAGTLKRLGTSASSALASAQSALNSAVYLGLPEKMIVPLQLLSTLISALAAFG